MMNELKDTLSRAGWRALDGLLTAVAFDVLVSDISEWKVAAVAAGSAGIKPIMAYVARKAGRA
jgi:hypothetical protein